MSAHPSTTPWAVTRITTDLSDAETRNALSQTLTTLRTHSHFKNQEHAKRTGRTTIISGDDGSGSVGLGSASFGAGDATGIGCMAFGGNAEGAGCVSVGGVAKGMGAVQCDEDMRKEQTDLVMAFSAAVQQAWLKTDPSLLTLA
jgi:hypothetical protein